MPTVSRASPQGVLEHSAVGRGGSHSALSLASDHNPLLDNVEVGGVRRVLRDPDVVQVGEHGVSLVLSVVHLGWVAEHVGLEQDVLDQLVVSDGAQRFGDHRADWS